jgi:hypothetical protein
MLIVYFEVLTILQGKITMQMQQTVVAIGLKLFFKPEEINCGFLNKQEGFSIGIAGAYIKILADLPQKLYLFYKRSTNKSFFTL